MDLSTLSPEDIKALESHFTPKTLHPSWGAGIGDQMPSLEHLVAQILAQNGGRGDDQPMAKSPKGYGALAMATGKFGANNPSAVSQTIGSVLQGFADGGAVGGRPVPGQPGMRKYPNGGFIPNIKPIGIRMPANLVYDSGSMDPNLSVAENQQNQMNRQDVINAKQGDGGWSFKDGVNRVGAALINTGLGAAIPGAGPLIAGGSLLAGQSPGGGVMGQMPWNQPAAAPVINYGGLGAGPGYQDVSGGNGYISPIGDSMPFPEIEGGPAPIAGTPGGGYGAPADGNTLQPVTVGPPAAQPAAPAGPPLGGGESSPGSNALQPVVVTGSRLQAPEPIDKLPGLPEIPAGPPQAPPVVSLPDPTGGSVPPAIDNPNAPPPAPYTPPPAPYTPPPQAIPDPGTKGEHKPVTTPPSMTRGNHRLVTYAPNIVPGLSGAQMAAGQNGGGYGGDPNIINVRDPIGGAASNPFHPDYTHTDPTATGGTQPAAAASPLAGISKPAAAPITASGSTLSAPASTQAPQNQGMPGYAPSAIRGVQGGSGTVSETMRNDWNGFFDSTPAGQVVDWAGGKLQNMGNGQAWFASPDVVNGGIMLDKSSIDNPNVIQSLMAQSPGIAREWARYGLQPDSGAVSHPDDPIAAYVRDYPKAHPSAYFQNTDWKGQYGLTDNKAKGGRVRGALSAAFK